MEVAIFRPGEVNRGQKVSKSRRQRHQYGACLLGMANGCDGDQVETANGGFVVNALEQAC
jgi:hypothetical protein